MGFIGGAAQQGFHRMHRKVACAARDSNAQPSGLSSSGDGHLTQIGRLGVRVSLRSPHSHNRSPVSSSSLLALTAQPQPQPPAVRLVAKQGVAILGRFESLCLCSPHSHNRSRPRCALYIRLPYKGIQSCHIRKVRVPLRPRVARISSSRYLIAPSSQPASPAGPLSSPAV